MEKTQTVPKPKRKIFSSKVLILISIPVVIVFVSIITLIIINPDIKTGSVEAENISVTPAIINKSTSDYPVLKFDSKHEIIFENGTKVVSKNYQVKKEDLIEGENNIKVYKLSNFLLFTLKSKEPTIIQIILDLEDPEFTIGEYQTYYLLEDTATVNIGVEEGIDIKNDETIIEPIDGDGNYEFTLIDGDNEFTLKAVDTSGNESAEQSISIEAFKPDGWQKLFCQELAIPLNRNILQIDFGNDGTALYSQQELDTFTANCQVTGEGYHGNTIQLIGTIFPCTGACDAYLPYIDISVSTDSLTTIVNELTTEEDDDVMGYYSNGTSVDYTSNRGIVGKMVEKNYNIVTQSGDYTSRNFVFEQDGITYNVSMAYEKTKTNSFINSLTVNYNAIIDNMIFTD